VVCLRIFFELAEEVFTEQEFTLLDNALANELHAAATPAATSFLLIVTRLGSEVLWIVGIAVGIYFLLRRERLRLGVWIAALVGGEALNWLLKQWFARARPQFDDPLAVALFYSFPSGHAMMSLIMYGLLAYFVWLSTPHRWVRVLVTTALILLILLIGFSRLYLGVHYFSDVLAGFAAGGVWLSFCISAMNLLHERWRRRQIAT
jgi:undecaprenyl-diphosphatase